MLVTMYFVDRIQAQGTKQRKIPVPKKFWKEFPLGSLVKIELQDNPHLFFVDIVQTQGKIQRRIAVPRKFWEYFPVGAIVKVEGMRNGK